MSVRPSGILFARIITNFLVELRVMGITQCQGIPQCNGYHSMSGLFVSKLGSLGVMGKLLGGCENSQ